MACILIDGVIIFVCLPSLLVLQADLPKLREVLFIGNPIYDQMEPSQARLTVVKYIPHVSSTLDGFLSSLPNVNA